MLWKGRGRAQAFKHVDRNAGCVNSLSRGSDVAVDTRKYEVCMDGCIRMYVCMIMQHAHNYGYVMSMQAISKASQWHLGAMAIVRPKPPNKHHRITSSKLWVMFNEESPDWSS